MSDNCDRTKINGDKYAVTENGRALVPIRMFQLTNPIECIWNGNKYQRNSHECLNCRHQSEEKGKLE